ncbi:response regulator transcription factor [Tellurirhabdus rosea]|uniref:response regulator transcription factor n=1 Tax=Tellurirhabdus rosea TaxID=2674997 RepID=UPI00224C9D5F|nr:response regulator transcription factor [Tellurirhabdus rosea]
MSAPRARILYVEDDVNLSFVTKDNLELAQFQVEHHTSGLEAWAAFGQNTYDLCILDVMLPGSDGFELARRIRENDTQVPILFLSALSDKDNRLKGFRLGGDDYLTKPFSIEELLLKIDVFLRRCRPAAPATAPPSGLVLGQYCFDRLNLTLRRGDEAEVMTHREAEVLLYLYERRNTTVRRDDILRDIWGDNDYFMGRSLDVFISRLRKRLRHDPALRIENHHGVGFRFLC